MPKRWTPDKRRVATGPLRSFPLRQRVRFLRTRLVERERGSAEQWSALGAQRGVHHQLSSLPLWPPSGGYFAPVDVNGFWTAGLLGLGFQSRGTRQTVHKFPVYRHLPGALRAGSQVTRGFTNDVRRKAGRLVFGLGR